MASTRGIIALLLVAVASRVTAQATTIAVIVSPTSGTHVTSPSVSITWDGCAIKSPYSYSTTVNGTEVTTTQAGTGSACQGIMKKRYTASATLTVGANLIAVEVCDIYGCGSADAWVYLDVPGITVTPASVLAPGILPGSSGSATFSVVNSGSVAGTAQFSVSSPCVSPLVSCAVSPTSASLSPGASTTVTASYTGTGGGGPAVMSFVASYSQYPSVTSTGEVSVVVLKPVAQVVVTVDTSLIEINQSRPATARTYAADGQELTGRTVTWTGSKMSASPASGSTAATTTITAQTAGAGSITATSEGVAGSKSITVVDGSGRNAATLALAYTDRMRDVGRCAAACFAATVAYSTPSYRSVDVERGVTLLYRSDRARPIMTIQIDATDNSATPAQTLSLRLQRADNGNPVTFINGGIGTQELYFTGGAGVTRLVGQFDATAMSTQSVLYTAIVTSRWANGVTRQATVPARVLIVNEAGSDFGAGWQLAEMQRAFVQSDGVMITSGDGSASFFTSCSGTCQLPAPASDFSTLSRTASGSYERRYPDGTKFVFTAAGLLSNVIDRWGSATSFGRDGSARVISITDPIGYAISIGYDGNGKINAITTPASSGLGRTSQFFVNASGDLQWARDPDNIINFSATYTSHRLTSLTDRRGGVWDYGYAVDNTNSTEQAPYITAGAQFMRPTTTLVGPATNAFVAISQGAGTSGNPVSRTIDLRAKVTNARGHATYFALNRFGSPTRIDDALGRASTSEYHATTGQPTRSVAVSGHDVRYTWDGPRLTQVWDVTTGQIVNTSYEATYNQPTHIWGNTVEQWFYYNAGNVLQSSRRGTSSAPLTTYTFDAYGRPMTVVDAGGHARTTYYASTGLRNADSVGTPGRRLARFGYDVYGRVVATFRPPANTIDSVYYDLLGRTTQTVVGIGGAGSPSPVRTTFAWDLLYLRTVTDAKGQQYTYTRNALGWVELETRFGSANALRTFYDANGGVDSTINRRNGVVRFVHDALDRVTSRTADGLTTTYAFGSADNFRAVTNGESTDTLFLGASARPTSATTWRGASRYTLVPSYNTDGTRSQLAATSNMWTGTRSSQMTYTALQEPEYFTTFAGTSTLGYSEGVQIALHYPNGLSKSQPITSIHGQASGEYNVAAINTVFGIDYGLDSLGRIDRFARAAVTDSLRGYWYNLDGSLMGQQVYGPYAPCGGMDPDFGYVCYGGPSIVGWTYSYSWDLAGNPTAASLEPGSNRLSTYKGFTLTYDADGNLRHKVGNGSDQWFEWNTLGQLTRVTGNGYDVQFGYDGLGRRVRKSVAGGATTRYLYDGDDVLMELDGSGGMAAEYAYLPGTDRPHAVTRNGTTYYYITDARAGSVRGLVRASDKAIAAQYSYSPFGTLEAGAIDTLTNPRRFAAREFDSESGIYYNRARYYDPSLERFISEDPIGIAGGINLYAYAGNDPVNRQDPSGTTQQPECYGHWEIVSSGGEIWSETWYSDFCYAIGGKLEIPFGPPTLPPNGPGGGGGGKPARPGSDTNGQQPTFGQCVANAGVMFTETATAALAGATALFAGLKARSYGNAVARAGARISDRIVEELLRGPINSSQAADLEAGNAMIRNGQFLSRIGTALARTGVVILGGGGGYFIGASAMCAFDREYYGGV